MMWKAMAVFRIRVNSHSFLNNRSVTVADITNKNQMGIPNIERKVIRQDLSF